MKKLSSLVIINLLCLSIIFSNNLIVPHQDTIVQNYHKTDKVLATKKEALIRVKLTDFKQNKLGNTPLVVHNYKGQYWAGTTDEKGEVFFLLPNNHKYCVNVEGEENYRKFTIPKEANYFKTVKVVLITSRFKEKIFNDTVYQTLAKGITPTANRALVNILIRDLDHQPLVNEEIVYEGKKSKKVFYAKTDKNGQAQLFIPKGETYCIHTYAFRNIKCKTYEARPTSRTSTFQLNMISTSEFKKREAERRQLLAERDSLRRVQRIRDSINLVRNTSQNFYLQHRYKNRDFQKIEASINKVVQIDQKAIAEDPNYYSIVDDEIKAMFYRNKSLWPKKRIIANIDCSMYQYIDELMVWNYSNMDEQSNNTYYLFNGFNYVDDQHDGNTRRGIFEVNENNVSGFFTTIDKIVNFSCRGSRLENVVEALILGAQHKQAGEEMVFIADNYSDVSDLHLLDQLDTPVHVLLTASHAGINENYLEIAYRTGGSIHTIQEDITANQLAGLQDGEKIKIGKFSYTFLKGKFLKRS